MSRQRQPRPSVGIIGAGRLASALVPLLGPAGYRLVALCAPRLAAARRACRGIRQAHATTRPADAAARAELLLLAVPDRALAPLAGQLAAAPGLAWKDRVVLHHAGALGLEPLLPLARAGASTGLLHPLQSLGSRRLAPALLPGSRARIEGDRRARTVARRLARDIGLVELRLRRRLTPRDRAAYHAAAAMLSNDLVALVAIGAQSFQSLGLDRREALRALLPLARGTLLHLEREGVPSAITGPVARGDLETISRHLSGLTRLDARIHGLLSLRLAQLVEAEGEGLPRGTLARLRRLLAEKA